jgi:hypothetical protein
LFRTRDLRRVNDAIKLEPRNVAVVERAGR